MKTITTENRPSIIPSNWVCENCQFYDRERWTGRGACLASFEHGEPHKIAVYADETTPLCSRVALEGYVVRKCVDDNKLHLRGDFGHADDGLFYSLDYCNAYFYHCTECGVWITDYMDYDSDLSMCNSCADEYYREHNRIIGDWHEHKGCFSVIGDRNDPYTFGWEIEVEGYDADHEATAHEIDYRFPERFFFEYDCSLYDGFEIISEPHTRDAFEAFDLEGLETLLIESGYEETDEASTTGLHVHFSTAFLGDSYEARVHTLARMVRFYDHNFDTLRDMTERKDVGHCYRNCNENRMWSDTDYDDDFELVERQVDGSRYVAVNCTNFNRGTIEIRLCDGTIRADKIRAWIDFNIAVMDCLQEHDTKSLMAVVPYMSDRCVDFFADAVREA